MGSVESLSRHRTQCWGGILSTSKAKKVTDVNDKHKNLNFVASANGIMECLMLENDMVRFVLRKDCRGV